MWCAAIIGFSLGASACALGMLLISWLFPPEPLDKWEGLGDSLDFTGALLKKTQDDPLCDGHQTVDESVCESDLTPKDDDVG